MISIVYYSDRSMPAELEEICFGQLHRAVMRNVPSAQIVTVTWTPFAEDRSDNIIWPKHVRCYESLFGQMIMGIEHAVFDTIFTVEHDVLYPGEHFALCKRQLDACPNSVVYNMNRWLLSRRGYFKSKYRRALSCMAGHRDAILPGVRKKLIESIRRKLRLCELTSEDTLNVEHVESKQPVVDIRWGSNFTGDREPESESDLHDTLHPWGESERYFRWQEH